MSVLCGLAYPHGLCYKDFLQRKSIRVIKDTGLNSLEGLGKHLVWFPVLTR